MKKKIRENIYLKTPEGWEAMKTKGNKIAKKADLLKVS